MSSYPCENAKLAGGLGRWKRFWRQRKKLTRLARRLNIFSGSSVADLKIWTKLHVCSWHYSTTRQCVLESALLANFAIISNRSGEICKGDFSTTDGESYWERSGSVTGSLGSKQLSIGTNKLISYRLAGVRNGYPLRSSFPKNFPPPPILWD